MSVCLRRGAPLPALQLFLAGKSGSLIVLSLKDGEQNDVPAVGDHMGAITGAAAFCGPISCRAKLIAVRQLIGTSAAPACAALEPNLVLDHIVTAGLDGRLKASAPSLPFNCFRSAHCDMSVVGV